MKTTRAMLVIGVLMLVLAVIVAQGLRPEETATVSAPVVSGTVSREPEPPAPAAPNLPAVPDAPAAATPAASAVPPGGVTASRDAETLKMDFAAQARPEAPAAADSPAGSGENVVAANPAPPSPPPAASGTGQGSAAGRDEQPRAPEKLVVTTSAPRTLAAGQKAISRTRLEIGPSAATFRLTGASALQGKAFVLKEPDRVVVDLNGAWGINLGRTPANTILKSVRAGSQEANTRIVFDMHRAPKSFKLVQVDPRTLELQLR